MFPKKCKDILKKTTGINEPHNMDRKGVFL